MTGSASEMQPLGSILSENGFQVTIPTLSGHSSKLSHFKTTKTAAWIKDAYQNLELCSQHSSTKVHLIGHSFGASLGLYLALFRPSLIASLTLISPTFVIKPIWAHCLIKLLSYLPEKAIDLLPLLPKRHNNMYCLVVPRTAYPVYSIGAAARMMQIIARIVPKLSHLAVNTLILRDPNDHLSHQSSLNLLRSKCRPDLLEIIELEDANHELLAGKHRQQAFELIRKFIS
jgi:esterase/lipase